MTEKNYIGLLDSGVGGLSVLAQLYKIMPQKNYMFFGDTKNVPYGTKSKEQILDYTSHILKFFLNKNVKYIVIACNTTSALAYEELREEFKGKLKIFPLIQLAAAEAVFDMKAKDKIAILATRATINSHKYKEEIHKINPEIDVLELDCTGFVEIVEDRLYHDPKSLELIKSKLDMVRDFGAKRLIMGCTHYPYLEGIFKKFLDIEYFNPAESISNIVKNELDDSVSGSDLKFYVSRDPAQFIMSAKPFFDVKTAEYVNLD